MNITQLELDKHSTKTAWLYGGALGEGGGWQDFSQGFQLTGVRIVSEEYLQRLVAAVPPVPANMLIVAYLAQGAFDLLRGIREVTHTTPDLDKFHGQLGFIDAVIEQEPLLRYVSEHIIDHWEHPGVYLYDVVEPFGRVYGNVLLTDGSLSPRTVLRDIMQGEGYPDHITAAAIAYAESAV